MAPKFSLPTAGNKGDSMKSVCSPMKSLKGAEGKKVDRALHGKR